MLELDSEAVRGVYICDVLLTKRVEPDDFLPVVRELAFPRAVPFRFAFPPRIADPLSAMGPMMDSLVPAFGNHGTAANGTRAGQSRRWWGAFAVYKRETHALLPASQSVRKRASAVVVVC